MKPAERHTVSLVTSCDVYRNESCDLLPNSADSIFPCPWPWRSLCRRFIRLFTILRLRHNYVTLNDKLNWVSYRPMCDVSFLGKCYLLQALVSDHQYGSIFCIHALGALQIFLLVHLTATVTVFICLSSEKHLKQLQYVQLLFKLIAVQHHCKLESSSMCIIARPIYHHLRLRFLQSFVYSHQTYEVFMMQYNDVWNFYLNHLTNSIHQFLTQFKQPHSTCIVCTIRSLLASARCCTFWPYIELCRNFLRRNDGFMSVRSVLLLAPRPSESVQ